MHSSQGFTKAGGRAPRVRQRPCQEVALEVQGRQVGQGVVGVWQGPREAVVAQCKGIDQAKAVCIECWEVACRALVVQLVLFSLQAQLTVNINRDIDLFNIHIC